LPRPPKVYVRLSSWGVFPILSSESLPNWSKLSTTDLLVLASMKNAAKCDK
jgi:hypothetical protein